MQIFDEILFFKATHSTNTNKSLSVASRILAEGSGHETDVLSGIDKLLSKFMADMLWGL